MRTAIVALAVAAGASTAMANSVTISATSLVAGTSGGVEVVSSLRSGTSIRAGQIRHNVTASTSSHVDVGTLYTFCTEIAQSAGPGDFNVGKLSDAPVPGPACHEPG